MILKSCGEIFKSVYALGSNATPVYLLDGSEPVLFDAGFTGLAHAYVDAIRSVLGNRPPAWLFLTHSHFDHVGSASVFKKAWPQMKIAGSSRSGEILSNPKAIKMISRLNQESMALFSPPEVPVLNTVPFESIAFDREFSDGESVSLACGTTIEVFNTPGHTWDFLSYWLPDKRVLIASEAVGCYENETFIQPEFLVNFDVYLESLDRLAALDPRVLCAGHHAVFTELNAPEHIQASVEAAHTYRIMVEQFLEKEDGNIERVTTLVKAVHWDPLPWPKQPETPYLINTRQRVKVIWERMKKV